MHVSEVRADLLAEQLALDEIVAAFEPDRFGLATPSPGWTVADQIAHLAYFDETAAQAIGDPAAFEVSRDALLAHSGDDDNDEFTLGEYRAMSPSDLLAAWRQNRTKLADASADLADDARVEWYGPSMGSKSFLTARLMEVWTHGQDIIDTVGLSRDESDRVRHIAQLGFITRGWSYINRGLEAPDVAVGVELTSPSGEQWKYGPDDAAETVIGSAVDFCLVVTQRRHVADTSLVVSGEAALEWMHYAQAFAGGASNGPPAGTWT